MEVAAALAILGAVLLSIGVAIVSIAAGLATAGVLCLCGAYVVAYIQARKARVP